VQHKLDLIDRELDQLKKKGQDAERIRIHQSTLEEMRKTKKRKRSERAVKRKQKTQGDDGLTSKEQEAESMAQK